MNFPYYYAWKLTILWGGQNSPYYGRRCRVVARGASKNSRLIEFENGETIITSGNALRKVKA